MTPGPAFRATIALAAALVLAGCGVPGSATAPGTGSSTAPGSPDTAHAAASDPPGATLAERLRGREFETAGAGDVTGYALVPGSQLTLSFYRDHQNADAFGGSVGCNSMGGTAAWDGDTVRAAEGLARTEMACEGLMDQEDWWAGLLNAGITLALDGATLTVTATGDAGSVTIRMTDSAVRHPDVPLAGTVWRLDGIIEGAGDGGSVSSVPQGLTASMTLSRAGDGHLRLDVFDGLTWLSTGGTDAGAVTIEPADDAVDSIDATAGTVRVTSGLAGDAAGCPGDEPDCRLEAVLLLGSGFAFGTDRDRLTVTGLGDHEGRGLMFVADPAAPSPDFAGGTQPGR